MQCTAQCAKQLYRKRKRKKYFAVIYMIQIMFKNVKNKIKKHLYYATMYCN